LPIDEIILQLIDAAGIKDEDGSFYLNGMKFPPNYDFAKDRREFLSNQTPQAQSAEKAIISETQASATSDTSGIEKQISVLE